MCDLSERRCQALRDSLNRTVKIGTNRASRSRHLDHFAVMLYLTVSNLDIPAQIMRRLRKESS